MIALSTSVLSPPAKGTSAPPVALAAGDFSEALNGVTIAPAPLGVVAAPVLPPPPLTPPLTPASEGMATCQVVIGKAPKPGLPEVSDAVDTVPADAQPPVKAGTAPPMPLPAGAPLPVKTGQSVAADGKSVPADTGSDDPAKDIAWLPAALMPIHLPLSHPPVLPKFAPVAPLADPPADPPSDPGAPAVLPVATGAIPGTGALEGVKTAPDILVADPAGEPTALPVRTAGPDILVADPGSKAFRARAKAGPEASDSAEGEKVKAKPRTRTTPIVPDILVAVPGSAAENMPGKTVSNPDSAGRPSADTADTQGNGAAPVAAAADGAKAQTGVPTVRGSGEPDIFVADTGAVPVSTKSGSGVKAAALRDTGTPASPLSPPVAPIGPDILIDSDTAAPGSRISPGTFGADETAAPVARASAISPEPLPSSRADPSLPASVEPVNARVRQAAPAPDIFVVDPAKTVAGGPVTPASNGSAVPIASGANASPSAAAAPSTGMPDILIAGPAAVGGTTTLMPRPPLISVDNSPAVAPDTTKLDVARRTASPLTSTPAIAATAIPPVTSPGAVQPAGQVFAAAIASVVQQARRDERDPVDARPAMTIATSSLEALQANAVVATADARHVPLDLTQDRGVQGMIDHIEMLRDGADANDTRIRLVPDALGAVDVTVRKDGDRVHVHFAAENRASAQLLSDAQPRLAEQAEARGLKLGQTSVETSADSNRGQARQQRPEVTPPARPASAIRTSGSAPAEPRIA